MGDAGDRNGLQGNQRRDSAADVHKGAIGFQMGDGGGENVSGNGVLQELLQGQLLGPATGKLGHTVFKAGDNKAGGFAHAGENGDVPGCALPDAQGALLPGDDAVKVAALYV